MQGKKIRQTRRVYRLFDSNHENYTEKTKVGQGQEKPGGKKRSLERNARGSIEKPVRGESTNISGDLRTKLILIAKKTNNRNYTKGVATGKAFSHKGRSAPRRPRGGPKWKTTLYNLHKGRTLKADTWGGVSLESMRIQLRH